jgi:hypothetical protein
MISNPTNARIVYLDPLRLQYRELLELRERVREAEAAAAPKAIHRPLLTEDWMRLPEAEELIQTPLIKTNTTPSLAPSRDASDF